MFFFTTFKHALFTILRTEIVLVALLFVFAMVPGTVVAQSGLVGYFPFNGSANDQSGFANNGTVYGATLTTDRFDTPNSAYQFNGISDYIEMLNTNFPIDNSERTVCAWIKTSSTGTFQAILNWGGTANTEHFGAYVSSNNKAYFRGQSSDVEGTSTITDNNWHFIVVTRAGSLIILRVDNNTEATAVRTINTVGNNFNVGRKISTNNEFFNGTIDDIRIFNRSLSSAEITSLYTEAPVTYTLTTNAVNGTITKNPDQTIYSQNAVVQLTGAPSTGYHFVNWSGDASGTVNPLTITMNGNKTVTANFEINTYALTVNATNGTVTKNPDQAIYNHGTQVILTATPTTGYHFVNWSGNLSGTENPDTLIMDGSKIVTANFEINTYALTVNATNGTVTKNPDQTSYNHGTQVQLTAIPATGYHFVNWTGDASATTNPLTITMDGNITVTANFEINIYTLTVSATNGTVTKNPDQTSYNHGTSVQVSQTADRGYSFAGWSGDIPTGRENDNPLTVTIDGNKVIQANYVIDSDYEILYRTAKYETWATAKDAKSKLKSVARKADKVLFKFNLVADSTRILLLDFGMSVNASITRGKEKLDTILTYSGKKLKDTLTTELSRGDTIQVEGVGAMGKKIAVKYQWGKSKAVIMKADSLYKINRVGLPMPNLHNLGEELFPKGFGQTSAYFTNGLLVGIPQGTKKANSVIHNNYSDVQKSMVKIVKKNPQLHSDTLTARCLDSLDGTKKKAMSTQQKGLPPDKQNNKLFAEVLTLKLNIAASASEKFPAGLGQLTFDDPNNVSNPFNGKMVDSIVTKADTMLSCLLDTVITASTSTSNTTVPFQTSNGALVGQSFTTGSLPVLLHSISLKIFGPGNGGEMFMRLFQDDGTSLNGKSPIATSNKAGYFFNVTDPSVGTMNTRFFNGVTLAPNTAYTFVLFTSGLNFFRLGADSTNPYAGGVRVQGSAALCCPASGFSAVPGEDLYFTVNSLINTAPPLEQLYQTVRMINCAFSDSTIDTLSFASKTKLKGVKSLFDVDYLRPTPGIAPHIVPSFDVVENEIPEKFELYQNYPNPFNPSTQLSFVISQSSLVSLKVFNMLGQEVAILLNNEQMDEGEYELPFNASGFASGVYFYRINIESVDEEGVQSASGGFMDVKKMLMMK